MINQPGPEPTPVDARPRVAVSACASYDPGVMARAMDEAIEALGRMNAFVRPGQTVLIKPNLFVPHAPEDAVTTHPELVRQAIRLCVAAGAGRIWVGDSPVGAHGEAGLWSRTGMADAVAGTPAQLKSWHGRQASVDCGSDILAVPEWLSQVDAIVSLPKLKTHCLTTLTCGLKNVFGIVSGQAKAQFHTKYPSPETMSAFLVRVFAALKPHLTIADAVVAMEGNGPAHGQPRSVGALLASRDAVALDAIACLPLAIEPEAVPMIRLAAAAGLGTMDRSCIECVGSGLACLRAARMRPSLSRWLGRIPEWMYGGRLRPLRMRPKIRESLCSRCGMCEASCPRQAIGKHPGTGYPAINRDACIDCFCCLESCPQGAIAVQYSLAGLLRLTRDQPREGGCP